MVSRRGLTQRRGGADRRRRRKISACWCGIFSLSFMVDIVDSRWLKFSHLLCARCALARRDAQRTTTAACGPSGALKHCGGGRHHRGRHPLTASARCGLLRACACTPRQNLRRYLPSSVPALCDTAADCAQELNGRTGVRSLANWRRIFLNERFGKGTGMVPGMQLPS